MTRRAIRQPMNSEYIGAEIHPVRNFDSHLALAFSRGVVYGDMGTECYTTDDTFIIENDFRNEKDGKGIHVASPPPEGFSSSPWMDLTIEELEFLFGPEAVQIVNRYGHKYLTTE